MLNKRVKVQIRSRTLTDTKEINIKDSTYLARRSREAEYILHNSKVLIECTAYPVKIDLNENLITVSSLAISKVKSRLPHLYLSAFHAGKDIIMIGYDLFDGSKCTNREALFFEEKSDGYRSIQPYSDELKDIEKAYKSIEILEGL